MLKKYQIILEGLENNVGYYIGFDVASNKKAHAINLALAKAKELGLTIVTVDEVNIGSTVSNITESKVIHTYGKVFFESP